MTDHDAIERLRTAMAVEAQGHHLDPGAADTALRDAAHRRPPVLAIAASLMAVLAIAIAAWGYRANRDSTPAAKSPTCAIDSGPLPTWARAGFTPDGYTTPHVVGRNGEITAVLFGTLRAQQLGDEKNKVLWVSKDDSTGPLQIRATLGDQTVTRTVDLGPSYVDLPTAGCWQLQLTWPGHSDRMALAYR